MSRLFLVNRFYWPEEPATAQLLTELATALAGSGIEVAVITSRPGRSARPITERRAGVQIERVWSPRWGARSLLGRACDFALFHALAGWRLFRRLRRGDTVVALTDPPLIGVTVALVARVRGARLVHWVQDIYPEIAVAVSGRRGWLALRALRDMAWRQAAICVVPGRQMAGVIAARGIPASRIIVCANWAPGALQPADRAAIAAWRARAGLGGRFVLMYSGNLGRVHDLTPLIELAALLQDREEFVLVFVGSGAQRAALEQTATTRGLRNVRFLPAQPLDQLAVALSAADVHLVTLRPGCDPYVYPSKLYGAAAVGRPVIVIADPGSELARTVTDAAFGQSFARDRMPEVAQTIVRLAHEPATCHEWGVAAEVFARDGLARAARIWAELPARPAAFASTGAAPLP